RGSFQADGKSIEQHTRPDDGVRALPLAQVRSDSSAGLLPAAFGLHDLLQPGRLAAAAEPVSLERLERAEGRDSPLQRRDRSPGWRAPQPPGSASQAVPSTASQRETEITPGSDPRGCEGCGRNAEGEAGRRSEIPF